MQAINSPAAEVGAPVSLLARAQAGDQAAFETIYSRHEAPVYRYVHRLVGSADDADHLTQDVFLTAYLLLPKAARAPKDVRIDLWLYGIATKVCLDELRQRRRVRRRPWRALASALRLRPRVTEPPEEDCSRTDSADELWRVLARLQPRGRACLVLRECEGLTYEEIAEVLDTTRARVRSLLFRAREEVRSVCASVEHDMARAA